MTKSLGSRLEAAVNVLFMVKDSENLRYQWCTGDGSEVTEDDGITIDRNRLIIQNFEKIHEGTYSCTISTSKLSMSAEVTLHLLG